MSVARGKATDFSCVTMKNITMKGANFLEKLLDNQPVEWKKLGEVCIHLRTGLNPRNNFKLNTDDARNYYVTVRELRGTEIVYTEKTDRVNDEGLKLINNRSQLKKDDILFSATGTIGKTALITEEPKDWNIKEGVYALTIDKTLVLPKFFLRYIQSKHAIDWILQRAMGSTVVSIPMKELNKLPIPVPPLSVQSRIVEILDKFTSLEAELEAELELRKKQYAYYREQLLNFSYTPPSEFNVVYKKLGEVADYEQPTAYLVKDTKYKEDYPTPVLTAGKTFILGYTNETEGIYEASKHPTIIFDDFTTALRWVDFDFKAKSSAMKMITSKDENVCLLKYIYYWLCTVPSEVVVGDHKRQWISNYANKDFPLPPLSEQARIVEILDKFDALTNSITEGLPLEIKLRKQQYEYYREQLLDFRRF